MWGQGGTQLRHECWLENGQTDTWVDGWLTGLEPWADGHMAEQDGLAEKLDTAQMRQRVSSSSSGHKRSGWGPLTGSEATRPELAPEEEKSSANT